MRSFFAYFCFVSVVGVEDIVRSGVMVKEYVCPFVLGDESLVCIVMCGV